MSNTDWQPGQTLADMEKKVILKAMKHFGNHRPTVASALDIAIRTLDNKLDLYEGKQQQQPSSLEKKGTKK